MALKILLLETNFNTEILDMFGNFWTYGYPILYPTLYPLAIFLKVKAAFYFK